MTTTHHHLARTIDALAERPSPDADARGVVEELLVQLEAGALRAAERGDDGTWRAVPWVKRGILLGLVAGFLTDAIVTAAGV